MTSQDDQAKTVSCDGCGKRVAATRVIEVPSLFAKDKFSSYCQNCAADVVEKEKRYPFYSGAGALLILSIGLGAIFAAFSLPVLARTFLVSSSLPGGFAFLWFGYQLRQRICSIREQIKRLAEK